MAKPKERKKALVISISDYNNDKLQNLEFCKNDGEKIVEFLLSQDYEIPDNRKLIGRVDWATMRRSILDFFQGAEVEWYDMLFFYFSGHGIPDSLGDHYFSTSEINPDKPDYAGFPFYELTNNMKRTDAEKIIIVIDCCYSGAAEIKGTEENAAEKGRSALQTIAEQALKEKTRMSKKYCILASSLASQSSYKMSDQPFSMFTYILLQGLKGGYGESIDNEGKVTPYDLGRYVQDKIAHLPRSKRPKQEPIIKLDTTGEIILARYEKPKKEQFQVNRFVPEGLFTSQIRPIRGGFSVANVNVSGSGTLGCLVRDKLNKKKIFILSADYVLAGEKFQIGDPILQPAVMDGGNEKYSIIAKLSRVVPPLQSQKNKSAGAVAELTSDIQYKPDIAGLGKINGMAKAQLGETVRMVGRTSGIVEGIVTTVDASSHLQMPYSPFKDVSFKDLIVCDLKTLGGDGGAIVLNKDNKAIGMVYAGSGTDDTAQTILVPIKELCDSLKVQII